MKQTLSLILVMITLLFTSCNKADILPTITSEATVNSSTDIYIGEFSQRLYSSCAEEYINFGGKVHISLRERTFENRFMRTYIINTQGVTGVGEKSGYIYHGTETTVGGATVFSVKRDARLIEQIKFTAAGGHSISYTFNLHYVINPDNTVAVDFIKGEENFVCK